MGRYIYCEVNKVGFGFDVYVVIILVNMYNSCGSMLEVWYVFNLLYWWDVVVWNVMMISYVR